eukprot:6074961-Pleurochrysis_carterae.AAC.1
MAPVADDGKVEKLHGEQMKTGNPVSAKVALCPINIAIHNTIRSAIHTELSASYNKHRTHATLDLTVAMETACSPRYSAKREAQCPISGAIHNTIRSAIHTELSEAYNTHRTHATLNLVVAMETACCPIYSARQEAFRKERKGAHERKTRDMQQEQCTQGIICGIDSVAQADNKQNTSQNKYKQTRIRGFVGHAAMALLTVFVGLYIGRICQTWLTRVETGERCNPSGGKECKQHKRETKAGKQDRKKILQRRLIQRRIRRWYKACRHSYDGKIRMKYRQKVRASKRWLKMRSTREAGKANSRV